jgi:hypothetical protein
MAWSCCLFSPHSVERLTIRRKGCNFVDGLLLLHILLAGFKMPNKLSSFEFFLTGKQQGVFV